MKTIKNIIILLIALTVISCGNNTNKIVEKKDPNFVADTFYLCDKLVKIDTISEEIYKKIPATSLDTSEMQCLLKDSAMVKRQGDSLIFSVDNNRFVVLANCNADNDSFSKYYYRGFNKDIDQYIVYGGFYEWYNYLLIDKVTGDTTYTCGEPVVSPNKKSFICGNNDLGAFITFNGIELYENVHRPKLICKRELQNWGPETIKWTSENTLFVMAERIYWDTINSATKTVYYKLTIK